MKARRAMLTISDDVLKRALHMPDSCSIVGGQVVNRYGWPSIELIVESPDLPEVEIPEGGSAPEIDPLITHEPEKWLWDWNANQ